MKTMTVMTITQLASVVCRYSCYYLTRNSLGFAAPVMVADKSLNMDITKIGALTSIFPIFYGFSKFASGVLGARTPAHILLAGGLMATAAVNICFGFGASLMWFSVFWAMNGLLQVICQKSGQVLWSVASGLLRCTRELLSVIFLFWLFSSFSSVVSCSPSVNTSSDSCLCSFPLLTEKTPQTTVALLELCWCSRSIPPPNILLADKNVAQTWLVSCEVASLQLPVEAKEGEHRHALKN